MEIQPTEFDTDFDIEVEDEMRWDTLDADRLVPTPRGAYPNIARSGGTSTSGIRRPSRAGRASTRVVDVPEGSDSEESEPDVDVEHPICSSDA